MRWISSNWGSSTPTPVCWLLGASVQEIGLFYTMEQAFLLKHVGYEYNQQSPFCVVCSDHAPIFTQKRFHPCCMYFPRSSNASVFACTRSKNVFCGGSNH